MKRVIRSYVRREGRMTPRQSQALEKLWPKYGLDFTAEPLHFAEVFGRQAPVILEIGFGMGQSLLTMAQQNPQQDFLGIEVHRPGVGALLASLAEQQVENVRVICHDAVEVLQQQIPDASLQAVQIFFPDPWPKKKHHKRRLIQPEFVTLLQQKLQSAGYLHLATDWQEYAKQMLAVLSDAPGWQNRFGAGNFADDSLQRPLTKFEKRGQRLGHGVWDLVFVKG